MTTEILTKEQALALFGDAKTLCAALNITRSAFYQWKDGEAIPELQDLKIRHQLKPVLFGGPSPVVRATYTPVEGAVASNDL